MAATNSSRRGAVLLGIGLVAVIAAGTAAVLGGLLPPGAVSALGLPASLQPGASGDPAMSQADQQLEAKLQPFIRCINGVDRELDGVQGRYRSELEYIRLTLAGKEPMMPPNIGGLRLNLNGYREDSNPAEDCAAGLERASIQPPAIPDLDQAGQDYARALRAMLPLFADAQPYYQQKDWKDDRFAKGAALDARLRPVLADAGRAGSAMRAALRGQENGLRTRQLAALEARSGRNARWQGLNVMLRAREMEDEIGRQAQSGSFSAKALQLGIEQLSSAWDEANGYAQGHSDKLSQGTASQRPIWDRIGAPASSYLATVKELRRAVEAGDRKPDAVRSGYDATVQDFNTLVDAFNAPY